MLSTTIVTRVYHKAMGCMKNLSLVIANPDRANIFMKSYKGPHVKRGIVDEFEELLSPIAEELIVYMSVTTMTVTYP